MKLEEVQLGMIFGDRTASSRWRGIVLPIASRGHEYLGYAEVCDDEGCRSKFPLASPLLVFEDLFLVEPPKPGRIVPTVTLNDCVIVHPDLIEVVSSQDFMRERLRCEHAEKFPDIPFPEE